MLRARDVMTREVISISQDATVAEAAALMVNHRISGLPVMDGNRVTGIVSEGDFIHRAEIGTAERHNSWWLGLFTAADTLAAEYTKSHSRHVADVMTRHVHTIAEITPVADVANLLHRHRIKRVPVIRHDALVGIVSRGDLLKAIIASDVQVPKAASTSDADMLLLLKNELQRQSWSTAQSYNVEVQDGVASFWGGVGSEEERKATHVLAENIAGMKQVHDHRVIIEIPMTAV